MGKSKYDTPPKTGNPEFDNFMEDLFDQINGLGADTLGGLDSSNLITPIPIEDGGTGSGNDPYARANHTGAQPASTVSDFDAAVIAEHNSITGSHSLLKQGADPADSAVSSVSVDTADADATYGTEERDLINELKADVNTLVTDANVGIAKLNALLASLRTAGVIV